MALRNRPYEPSNQRGQYQDRSCYECGKIGHIARNCQKKRTDDRTKLSQPLDNSYGRKNKRQRANLAEQQKAEGSDIDDHYEKGTVNMTMADLTDKDSWHIDSCASKHITNNRSLFQSMRPYFQEFYLADNALLTSTESGTIVLPTGSNRVVRIQDVADAPSCASNLISLGQLRKSGITYHDGNEHMILEVDGKEIARARRVRNLFVLEQVETGTVMSAQGRPNFFESSSEIAQLWHRRLGHVSHKRIKEASCYVDGLEEIMNIVRKKGNVDSPETSRLETPKPEPQTALRLEATNPKICETCVESKQTRVVRQDETYFQKTRTSTR